MVRIEFQLRDNSLINFGSNEVWYFIALKNYGGWDDVTDFPIVDVRYPDDEDYHSKFRDMLAVALKKKYKAKMVNYSSHFELLTPDGIEFHIGYTDARASFSIASHNKEIIEEILPFAEEVVNSVDLSSYKMQHGFVDGVIAFIRSEIRLKKEGKETTWGYLKSFWDARNVVIPDDDLVKKKEK